MTFYSKAFLISLVLIQNGCENTDKFYRPNLPEKLCCFGIIDADDTLRYISFEKSFQLEHSEDTKDSLRNFNFTISSSNENLIHYCSESTIKDVQDLRLADSVEFLSCQKYYINAIEESVPSISAEITSPKPPSEIAVMSIGHEVVSLPETQECLNSKIAHAISLDIAFENTDDNMYYAVLIEGCGTDFSSSSVHLKTTLLDFTIKETNSPGFHSVMYGLKTLRRICIDKHLSIIKSQVKTYLINGKDIPGETCKLKIFTQFNDAHSLLDIISSLRIKLLSIPVELYLFEKSIYSYNQTVKDPFSEPTFLNGNIKGGYGIFSVCRSTDVIIKLSPPVL